MSLNEQATDPYSHTSVRTFILYPLLSCHLHNPMVDSQDVASQDDPQDMWPHRKFAWLPLGW